LIKRIAITALIYIAYRLGFYITLVSMGEELNPLNDFWYKNSYSLSSLGFMPAVAGFFLVEIIFIIVPYLRKIRNKGFEGRKIINYWSLGISLIISALQAWATVSLLEVVRTPSRMSVISNPSFLTLTTYSLFFIAGFALVLFLGLLITKFGIGNGFCILLGISAIEEICINIYHYIEDINASNIKPNYIGFIVFILIVIFIVHLLRNKDWEIQINSEKIASLKIPFFLQGAIVIIFADTMIRLPSLLDKMYELPQYDTWFYALAFSLTTIFASLIGYWIFSGAKRIESNLGVASSSKRMMMVQLVISTLTLFIIVLFLSMPFPFWNQMFIPHVISTFSLFILIAIAIDLYYEARFIYHNKDYIGLCNLDNVYLASVIHKKFEDEGISCYIQGYQYRRLYFFFQPFIKMRLLVPKNQLDKARQEFNDIRTDFV